MKTEIPFAGDHSRGESRWIDSGECINFYPRTERNGKSALLGTPGLDIWWEIGNAIGGPTKECRGMLSFGDYLYTVADDAVYKMYPAGYATRIGGLNSSSGPVYIKTNGVELMIVDGVNGYLFDFDATFTQITDDDYPNGADTLAVVDGFFLVNNPETEQFYKSGYQDGSTWDPLDFSSVGGYPDKLKSIFVDHRLVWLFGEVSTEIFYNNGSSSFNFARIEGSFIETGIAAPHSVSKANNAVTWIAKDANGQYEVMMAVGMQPRIISTKNVNYRISQKTNPEDAIGITYQEAGHVFHCFIFPDDSAEIYDSSEDKWHQRQSKIDDQGYTFGRWRVNCHAYHNGDHLVGDFQKGIVYKMKNDFYLDGEEEITAIRTMSIIEHLDASITYNMIQIMSEPGIGLTSGQGSDPVALISWSDDGGFTWSNQHEVKLGKKGKYENRAILWGLGQGRNRVFRLEISDPVKRVIRNAIADIEVDND